MVTLIATQLSTHTSSALPSRNETDSDQAILFHCCTLTELIFSTRSLPKDLEIRLAQRTRYKRNLSWLCQATACSWTTRKVSMFFIQLSRPYRFELEKIGMSCAMIFQLLTMSIYKRN